MFINSTIIVGNPTKWWKKKKDSQTFKPNASLLQNLCTELTFKSEQWVDSIFPHYDWESKYIDEQVQCAVHEINNDNFIYWNLTCH